LGQTSNFHEMGILPSLGQHRITVVDAKGIEVNITIWVE
jgi:penicillin-binding protein 1C